MNKNIYIFLLLELHFKNKALLTEGELGRVGRDKRFEEKKIKMSRKWTATKLMIAPNKWCRDRYLHTNLKKKNI